MTTPHQPAPAEEQLVESSAFEAELFWEKNRTLILTAIGAVIAAILVGFLWYQHVQSEKSESSALFAEAADIAGWQKVVDTYPKSEAAANAYFRLAAAQRDAGDVNASTAAFEKFLDTFPKHPLADAATLGIGENLLLQGKTDDGLNKLRQVQGGTTPGYVASYAAFAEGRVLMLQGKLSEAGQVFTNVTQLYPNTPPATLSRQLLGQIDLIQPPAAPAASASPTPAPAAQ